jgi:DNA-binding GntR family transcriptional regulator
MPTASRGAVPLYQQIANDLRTQISDGTLGPGAQLPTQEELSERYATTRMTVRSALSILINEGLVFSEVPRGVFVKVRRPMAYRPQAESRPRPPSSELDQFMTDLSEEGRDPRQDIEVAIVVPPEEVAKRLRLGEGESAALRRRTRYIDGETYNLNDSYYPLDIVRDSEIMSPVDINRGANQVLAELGHRQVRALDELVVRMPTPTEADRLGLGRGIPIVMHTVTGFDAEDRPVRVVLNVLPGDRHIIFSERAWPDGENAE